MCCDLYIDNWKKYMDETNPGWNEPYMDDDSVYFDDEDIALLDNETDDYYGD